MRRISVSAPRGTAKKCRGGLRRQTGNHVVHGRDNLNNVDQIQIDRITGIAEMGEPHPWLRHGKGRQDKALVVAREIAETTVATLATDRQNSASLDDARRCAPRRLKVKLSKADHAVLAESSCICEDGHIQARSREVPGFDRAKCLFWGFRGFNKRTTHERQTNQLPSASKSILVRRKQSIASCGRQTTGSFSLKDVFRIIGTPVSARNASIRR